MTIEEKRAWAKDIVLRMMRAWGVEEMQDLSRFIGGHLRMPSNWISKGVIPWEVVYTCHLETGASLDWLYNGKVPVVEATEQIEQTFRQKMVSLLAASERMGFIRKDKSTGFIELAGNIAKEAVAFFTFNKGGDESK